MKYIDYVERISPKRCDTWVCIKPKCGIEYDETIEHEIEKEILEIVNAQDDDLFLNGNGFKKFKKASYVCECGENSLENEHWILEGGYE